VIRSEWFCSDIGLGVWLGRAIVRETTRLQFGSF